MRNPDRYNVTLGSVLCLALLLMGAPAAFAQNVHTLPLFMPADAVQQGFVRIINDSENAGTVRIHAIDDEGERFGPVELSLDGLQSSHFNSGDLENGNTEKGLSGGVGDGSGNWRLELDTDLDIEALAYFRTPQGFVAGVHDVVEGASMRWRVHFFNPASNLGKKSLLRVINVSGIETEVEIEGRDDLGASGESTVRFTLPADGARMLSAQELEGGYNTTGSEFEFEGSFGDGTRKWQLIVSAGRPIQVMSLMLSSDGLLSNLSTATRDEIIRGTAGADELWGGNGNDVIDPGDNSDGFDLVHGSSGDDRIVYTGSGPDGYQQIDYSELEAGVTATIDGEANQATVDKGTAGTDTIVDIANPLNAGGSPPSGGGFALHGTPSNDVFHLTLVEGQSMNVVGNDGADTFNINDGGGRVWLDYGSALAGVDVDLDAGRANDDGFRDIDSINGTAQGVVGSGHADTIRGGDSDEVFVGQAGNDDIDGGGGIDELRFDAGNPLLAGHFDIGDIEVDLGAGTATGTWNGEEFSYAIANIEEVYGGPGNDTLRGRDGTTALYGGDGNDELYPGDDGDDDGYIEKWIGGSTGNDRIVFTDPDPRAWYGMGYSGLDPGTGITARIDGAANTATVEKGSSGTDTFVDIVNPLRLAFNLRGSHSDDVFHLAVGEGQTLYVRGYAGDDTFNLRDDGGTIAFDYSRSPRGVDVDLGEGRVNDDGYGGVDTINGHLQGVRGSVHKDTIRGSDNDEWFNGSGGDDDIDGGGGDDRLNFGRSDVAPLFVDMGDGTAVGSWNGRLFNTTFSNIEHVAGGPFFNILIGTSGDDTMEGTRGFDLFVPDGGIDTIIYLNVDDDDRLWLDNELIEDHGLTHADVVDAARQDGDDVLIDLSAYGEGTIRLKDFRIDWLSTDQIRL